MPLILSCSERVCGCFDIVMFLKSLRMFLTFSCSERVCECFDIVMF